MMNEREKVIADLKACTADLAKPDCAVCSEGGPGFGFACRDHLMRRALDALRETGEERAIRVTAEFLADYAWPPNRGVTHRLDRTARVGAWKVFIRQRIEDEEADTVEGVERD